MTPDNRHKWMTLIAMTGSLSMIFVDQTVVSVALPRIQGDLAVSQTGLQWIVNAYVLSLAATVALGGKIGDIFGRVHAFVAGVVLFALASAACGLAPNEGTIVWARAVQGLGAALMLPSSAAIVIDSFDLRERGKAMAIYVGVAQAFLALAPLLGGFLTEYLSWRWVFWINLPVAVLALVMTYVSKPPEGRQPGRKINPAYAGLLIAGMFAFVYGLQQGHDWGFGSPITYSLVGGGLLLMAVFSYFQLRADDPLIELRLFRIRAFTADAILIFCIQFAMIIIIVFGAIYLQNIIGFTPVETGLAFMPIILAVVVMSQMAGRIFDRVGVKAPALTGSFLIAVGFFSQAPFLAGANFWVLLPGMVVLGCGIGLVMVPTNTDALNRAPSDLRGQASGVMQTMRQVGATVGLASIGGVVAGLESIGASRIAREYGGGSAEFGTLVTGALQGQQDAVAKLAASSPEALEALKNTMSGSIAVGYYLAGGITVAAFLVALFLMKHGAQTEDAAHHVRGKPK